MNTFFLICFLLGFVLSILAAFGGFGRLHLGHLHLGHFHLGHAHVHLHTHPHANGPQLSAINGFTLPAFLCWFGGAGYLLRQYTAIYTPIIMALAVLSGLAGASVLYLLLFKFLLPHEHVLLPEDTRMDGVVARVSSEIRDGGGTGEIIFSQAEARRSAAARSESGAMISRGTEVVVLRYLHGIAYVSPLEEFVDSSPNSIVPHTNPQPRN